jgi:hypothetical protein
MKKILVLGAAVFAGLAVVFAPGVATANGNGAVVERDPYGSPATCIVVDTNGNFWLFDCTIQRVTTPNGKVVEYINGTVTEGSPLPDKAIHDVTTAETGLFCDFEGAEFIVQGVVTPSGQVHLTCRDEE